MSKHGPSPRKRPSSCLHVTVARRRRSDRLRVRRKQRRLDAAHATNGRPTHNPILMDEQLDETVELGGDDVGGQPIDERGGRRAHLCAEEG